MEQNTNYQVTRETAGFVEALRALQSLKERYINALDVLYDDEIGDNIYNELAPKFDEIAAEISKHLTFCIMENFGNLTNPRNII